MSNKPIKVLTEEGLRVLWNQISLDDYPNNDLLIAVLDGIDATKADKTEVADAKEEVLERLEAVAAAGADWNQNDETAIDYIKNRTHWIESGRVTIMEEQTVSSINWGRDESPIYTLSTPLEMGQTCIVTLNGVEYEGVFDSHHENKLPYLKITNGDFLFDPAGAASLGSKFTFVHLIEQNFTGIAKIEIDGGISYHTLDENFIPDTIARKSDLQNIDLSSLETKSDAASKLQEAKDYSDANLEVAQAYADAAKTQAITEGANSAVNTINAKLATDYYAKEQIDDMVFITTNDIDAICGASIQMASEVTF